MTQAIKVIKNPSTGIEARIFVDECFSEDPIHDCHMKHEALLVSFHRRSGSSHGFNSAEEAQSFAREKGMHIFAIRAYDHSGMGFKVVPTRVSKDKLFPREDIASLGYPYNCPWDSGWYGYLLVADKLMSSKEASLATHQRNCYRPLRRSKAFKLATSLLDTYSKWANGECYYVNTVNAEGETQDSLGGLIGIEWAEETAMEMLGLNKEAA